MSKLDLIDLAAVMQRLNLASAASALVEPETLPSEALAGMEQAGLLDEALRLVAHCLPQREAVWWACMCARHTAPEAMLEADALALAAAETWVWRREDAVRREAYVQAELGGFQSAEAWAAVAAFWSGDTLGPATQPAIAPPAHLTPIAIAGAVGLAATRGHGFDEGMRRRAFLASARDIGAGGPGRLRHESAPR